MTPKHIKKNIIYKRVNRNRHSKSAIIKLQDGGIMPKCWRCGKPNAENSFWEASGIRKYCYDCYLLERKERKNRIYEYLRLKRELMLERAIKILEKQKLDIYEYKEPIEVVADFMREKPEKLQSADEVVAAVILVDNEIPAKLQYPIGEYKVDFYLPTLKIVLEIDGFLHEKNLYADNERDKDIRKILGADWEIVRIKTKYIEQNAELLVEAIKAVRDEKKKLRRKNNGFLPDWYSKREFAKAPKQQNYGDEDLLTL